MEYYSIQVDKNLTSFKFYHDILPKLHVYAREAEKNPIVFDFTATRSVSPLVIPNLLCLGYIINKNYEISPTIYVPDNSASDFVRDYLHDIGFVQLAKAYGLFTFTSSIDYGTNHQIIDPLCATHEFNPGSHGENDESSIKNKVSQYFGKFFKKHLSNFQYSDVNDAYNRPTQNMVEEVCTQLIVNSIEHGNSFAFMTAQINYRLKKIYISTADCGIGFKTSINRQIENREEPFESRNKMMTDELEAIVNAIFARAEESGNCVYGLYPLIKRILRMGGTVRIHSVDTQLILTSNMLMKLEVASYQKRDVELVRKSFLQMLRNQLNDTHNIYTEMKYGGAHIEIEIPLESEGL